MLVALTGTPGTGKSTIAKILKKKYYVYSINKIVFQHKFIEKYDNIHKTYIVDTEKLNKYILEKYSNRKENIILVGHLAHFINADIVIVLRCSPVVLEHRLRKKKFTVNKIKENIEAECIDVITIEALNNCKNVYEVDTTNITPSISVKKIEEILSGKTEKYIPGNIDWSMEILKWY